MLPRDLLTFSDDFPVGDQGSNRAHVGRHQRRGSEEDCACERGANRRMTAVSEPAAPLAYAGALDYVPCEAKDGCDRSLSTPSPRRRQAIALVVAPGIAVRPPVPDVAAAIAGAGLMMLPRVHPGRDEGQVAPPVV